MQIFKRQSFRARPAGRWLTHRRARWGALRWPAGLFGGRKSAGRKSRRTAGGKAAEGAVGYPTRTTDKGIQGIQLGHWARIASSYAMRVRCHTAYGGVLSSIVHPSLPPSIRVFPYQCGTQRSAAATRALRVASLRDRSVGRSIAARRARL